MTAKPKPKPMMRSWTGYVLVNDAGDPLTDVLLKSSAIAAKYDWPFARIARVEIRELPPRKPAHKIIRGLKEAIAHARDEKIGRTRVVKTKPAKGK